MIMQISIFAPRKTLPQVLTSKDSGFEGALGATMLQGKQSHTISGVPMSAARNRASSSLSSFCFSVGSAPTLS